MFSQNIGFSTTQVNSNSHSRLLRPHMIENQSQRNLSGNSHFHVLKNYNYYIKHKGKFPKEKLKKIPKFIDVEKEKKLDDLLAVLAHKDRKESTTHQSTEVQELVRHERLTDLIHDMSCFEEKLRLKILLNEEMT